MKTYYARHTKISIPAAAIEDLRQRHQIAIHYPEAKGRPIPEYPDSESVDPEDYERTGARRALACMQRLATEGGYVVAEYRGVPSLTIGKVAPGSSITLERTTWDDGGKNQRHYPGRPAVIKALAYEKVGELPPAMLRNALAIAPQQSTLSQWHAIGEKVLNLAEGREVLPGLSDLHSSEQEVLCGEFLRAPTIAGVPTLSSLLLPIGRTAKDIDIYGVATDGKRLIAQVKYTHKESFVQDLVDRYGKEDCHLILFSGVSNSVMDGPVLQISLNEVYDQFCATERGAEWRRLISDSL